MRYKMLHCVLAHVFLTSRGFVIALLIFLLVNPSAYAEEVRPNPSYLYNERSYSELLKRLSPAVVSITTESLDKPTLPEKETEKMDIPDGHPLQKFFDRFLNKEQTVMASGSGFIIDSAGYIVTNNHVVDNVKKIRVSFGSFERSIGKKQKEFEAKIVGRDPTTDLALLKISHSKPLPYLTFGDSEKVQVGDPVLVIGNPFGLGESVSSGIISARSRDIGNLPFEDYFQTDASINLGNSGGPMLSTNGEVIGINTAIFSPMGMGSIGIGFAIPSNLAKEVVAELKTKGRILRGWLGVGLQEMTPEIAETLGLKNADGALVVEIFEGSPAEKAGIKRGDVILAYRGKKITEMKTLPQAVKRDKVGEKATLEIYRDGMNEQLEVILASLEEFEENRARIKNAIVQNQVLEGVNKINPDDVWSSFGIRLESLNDALKKELEIVSAAEMGLVISEVDTEHPFIVKEGLESGIVLLEANKLPLTKPSDFTAALKSALEEGKKNILLLGQDQGRHFYFTLPLEY